MHEDSIKFSLSSTDKGAVGFIPAQELAILISSAFRAASTLSSVILFSLSSFSFVHSSALEL